MLDNGGQNLEATCSKILLISIPVHVNNLTMIFAI